MATHSLIETFPLVESAGGSTVVIDLDRQLAFTYMMNKMDDIGVGSKRAKTYLVAVYKALGVTLNANMWTGGASAE